MVVNKPTTIKHFFFICAADFYFVPLILFADNNEKVSIYHRLIPSLLCTSKQIRPSKMKYKCIFRGADLFTCTP